MSDVLLDTSIVIALARADPAAAVAVAVHDRAAMSAVTLCGLHHGVLFGREEHRARRLAALAWAERTLSVLPVDERVAPHYGRLMAAARRERGVRPQTADGLIAATAAAHDLPLITMDRDFKAFKGIDVKLASST